MCRQIGFALRATTKRGGLPSGFAAGMSRRRFDLKVELQAIRRLFDITAPSTFVKRRRPLPTFGSRQPPRHEPGFARHEYPRMESQCPLLYSQPVALAIKYRDSHGTDVCLMAKNRLIFVQSAKQACSCAALGRIRVLAGGGNPQG